jgi:hypothetical protein
MVTTEELKEAYDGVELAVDETYSTGRSYESTKESLERLVLQATFEGKIQGKNEGERKAAAMKMFEQGYENLASQENSYKSSSNALAIARLHLDFVRDCIRIEELAKR